MWSLDYTQVKIESSSEESPSTVCKSEDKQSTPCESRQSESDSKFFPENFSPPVEMNTSQHQRSSMYSSMQSESGVTSPTNTVDPKPTFFNPGNQSESDDGAENSISSDQPPSTSSDHAPLSAAAPITPAAPDLEDFVFIENNQTSGGEKQPENRYILKPGK